ncbi:hypothetical protein [Paenibacillus vini]|uniref:Lipocalin-like domain-containing protein n=1 Tax=Paenibacillus vini TaxID=1476024 RepID=A0ABQ4MB79_9BACL|nr:hypothetical protein [Paenibacillus vini]GIP53248.1 hypothetical protein J42TS3_22830 [Paenibacillus vini]
MKSRVLFLLIVMFLLAGCSQDKAITLKGNWIAEYADQKVQTNEELSQFNYLEVNSNSINMKNFIYQIHDNNSTRVFNDIDKEVKYELKEANQIEIGNKQYEIVIKKNTMIIKNENIEVHYIKEE